MPLLHDDRLFPVDPGARSVARRLYNEVRDLPIISPHGHTDPAWYAENEPFPDPATLFLIPDHYLVRMLYSKGISMESLGISRADGASVQVDSRTIWRTFAEHYKLFRGTPSRLWMDHALSVVFGIDTPIGPDTADEVYDAVSDALSQPQFRPRALFETFDIEVIATTESPLDDLRHHAALRDSNWDGRVIPTFRPDAVVDPEFEDFARNLDRLGEITNENCSQWSGYLNALAQRRILFKTFGTTATDHGHPSAATADLDTAGCRRLFDRIRRRKVNKDDAELFRAQMLTEMARMSIDDGLVMQIHPGSFRNHNKLLHQQCGRDMGADIPSRTDYVHGLKPLLDRFGNDARLTVILFTLDDSTYSRELAPLAGHYPVLKLGPPWWFFDSPEGMLRFRRLVTETAGFYNTVGFNDDTRAFLSIPGRHDIARRVDCRYLAELVCEHQLSEEEAVDVARDLAYNLVKQAYRL